jgi:hypothetical protein
MVAPSRPRGGAPRRRAPDTTVRSVGATKPSATRSRDNESVRPAPSSPPKDTSIRLNSRRERRRARQVEKAHARSVGRSSGGAGMPREDIDEVLDAVPRLSPLVYREDGRVALPGGELPEARRAAVQHDEVPGTAPRGRGQLRDDADARELAGVGEGELGRAPARLGLGLRHVDRGPASQGRASERQRTMCPEPLPLVTEGTRSIERLMRCAPFAKLCLPRRYSRTARRDGAAA